MPGLNDQSLCTNVLKVHGRTTTRANSRVIVSLATNVSDRRKIRFSFVEFRKTKLQVEVEESLRIYVANDRKCKRL